MSLSIGSRVRLRVRKDSNYPGEIVFNGQVGTVTDIISNPWFPVRVQIDGCEYARYFRLEECEPIGEGEK